MESLLLTAHRKPNNFDTGRHSAKGWTNINKVSIKVPNCSLAGASVCVLLNFDETLNFHVARVYMEYLCKY